MGINLYWLVPWTQTYYQGLTIHGVLNALVWTTWFITGFLTYVTVYSLNRNLRYGWIGTLGLVLMAVGLLVAAVPLLLDMATVLYTFYPPMQAHWAFYVGVTVMVVGSWVVGFSLYFTLGAWYKDNPGKRAPLQALMAVITMAMWQVATLGVAVEELFMLIPWSMGLVGGIDPQLARNFFWFTGHPLVYFWLLPAYLSWYTMLPKQAGGKLFSDPMARLAFFLFLALSIPLGFHHQYVDPGIAAGWKYLHAVLTYAVFFPSLLTAFNVYASLNLAGKARGGSGVFGWILKLPWGNPSVAAQLLAAILFIFGGIGGLINASYNMNLVVHNTAWIPGHFHLTVGSAVTLTFMGILYWLLPNLTGRKLWNDKVALAQAWTWFVGMIIFSRGMHLMGLLGAPRRTMLGAAIKADLYYNPDWNVPLLFVGIGGIILFISYVLFFTVVLVTAFASKKLPEAEIPQMPVAEAAARAETGPMWLSRWKPWLSVTVLLILLAYGPILFETIRTAEASSPAYPQYRVSSGAGSGTAGGTGAGGGNIGAGEEIFNENLIGVQAGCVTCHSLEPDVVLNGPSLAGLASRAGNTVDGQSAEEYITTSILNPNDHVVEGFDPGVMPASFADDLSEEQVRDLVAYLMTLE
jgi:cytochrome c oxidase subunit 1